MEDHGDDRPPKEHIVNFALLIQLIRNAQGLEYHIESQNQGIPDSDVILIVETWLEKIKQNYKDRIMGGFSFGKEGQDS